MHHRKNYDIYHDPRWSRIRELCKQRYNGIDVYALYKYNTIIPGTLAHHIIPVEESKSLAYVLNNLIWVSDKSHSEIHRNYSKDKEKEIRYLVEIMNKFLVGVV